MIDQTLGIADADLAVLELLRVARGALAAHHAGMPIFRHTRNFTAGLDQNCVRDGRWHC